MASIHKKRLYLFIFLIIGLGSATALILYALSQNIDLFYTPTQVKEQGVLPHRTIRLGGMVVKESVKREGDLEVQFKVTDFENEATIYYRGILPDLFREGQGVVALGKIDEQGVFYATQILAKHDEKYMPPEIAASLKGKAL